MRSLVCALALVAALPAFADEIHPTREMLASARRMFQPNDDKDHIEYHFRRSGGVVLVCGYYLGANGGFCGQTTLSDVRKVDAMAEDACQQDSSYDPPHAITGEAIALHYKCVRGHMKRDPYGYAFDYDGYTVGQWRALPEMLADATVAPRFCIDPLDHAYDSDRQPFCGTVEDFKLRVKTACYNFEKGHGGTITACYSDQLDAQDAEAAAQKGRAGGQLP